MNDLSDSISKALMSIANLGFKILLLVVSLMIGFIAGIFKAK